MIATSALSDADLYRISLETATIAASPSRQGRNMPSNATATQTASEQGLYRQQDVDMVFRIKRLLYDEGFTIAGARRHLRDPNGASDVDGAALSAGGMAEGASQLLSRKMLLDLRDSLRAFLTLLE